MYRAIWNGVVLAETGRTVRLEGNEYFPPQSLNRSYFHDSRATTLRPWKGLTRCYTVVVDDEENPDAAWYYPRPSPLARRIKGRVAFRTGVRVERAGGERPAARGDGAGRTARLRRLFGG